MGGLLHLLDFNQSSMARKIFTHKRHDDDDDDGLEAPRNSLELQVENMKCFNDSGVLTYAYPAEEDWYEKSYYPVEASMKKLINEEIYKQSNSRRNTPSIVAKLMGMDTLPLDTKSAFQPVKENSDHMEVKPLKKEKNGRNLGAEFFSNSNSFRHTESKDRDGDRWRSLGQRLDKPRPREHPQEEELQKFKKEFEAFQAARFKECLKFAEVDSISGRFLAQESLNKEKMALYANSFEPKTSTLKPTSHERGSLNHRRHNSELFNSEHKESLLLRSKSLSRDIEFSSVGDGPTRIVILKPGFDKINDHEGSWASPSEDLEERGSMENFLQEVKERLKCELQGKNLKRGSVVRGRGIETPFREKPSDPIRIARNIAKHVRDGVGKEGLTLQRSESTRSYKSEIQFEKEEDEMQTRSFRCGDDPAAINRELSSRNLVRSLSAPVSGTSFGQLLLEDRHVLTGAHIRRKHEVIDGGAQNVRKGRKERFNFKEKVSHLKYSFSLRRKLFSSKIQSMEESYDPINNFMGGPTATMNFGDRLENSTEVPPSPASLCSSTQEEYWRQADCLSPLSTPDVTIGQDESMPQVFRDITTNLNELRRQLNELDSNRTENMYPEENPAESEIYEIGDESEAYIRDLLVASGFYDGTSDKYLSRWDPFAKPIGNSVFEKVEESYRKSSEENEITIKEHNEKKVDRKVLLDLLNEALSMVLGPPVTMSKFRRKMIGHSMLTPQLGRKLLDSVWEIIRVHLYPPSDRSYHSLDSMVEHDLGFNPWCGLMDEETNGLGREVECVIIGELLEEIVKDLLL